jgi:phosphoribosylformylglycinamidine cyclo-ligase
MPWRWRCDAPPDRAGPLASAPPAAPPRRRFRLNGAVAEGAYARAGVDQLLSGNAVAALVEVLSGIRTGRPSRAALSSGHYANVLRLDDRRGLALSCDSVGSKVIVCEQLGRYDTIGIDLFGMNANDVICVGADPIALLDYIAVEEANPEMLEQIGIGLRAGAEQAGVEIPGGELAVLPDVVRGHPSPRGFDLVGFCAGLVDLDAIVTGARIEPGDALIGLPSSGIHSNGLSLARSVLTDLDEEIGDQTVGDMLLEPTVIYVQAIRELLDSDMDVRGLAHITGDGFLNLLRLEAQAGYRIDAPLPVPPVFVHIAERGGVNDAELYEVFNMGCGFCVVVSRDDVEPALELLGRHHPGSALIGQTTTATGVVELPKQGLIGRRGEGFTPAS